MRAPEPPGPDGPSPLRLWWPALVVLVPLAAFVFFGPVRDLRTRLKLNRVDKDWQTLAAAMDALAIDHGGWFLPSDTLWRRMDWPEAPLTFETQPVSDPRIRQTVVMESRTFPLTTPVAYVAALPPDPFAPGAPYGYTRLLEEGLGLAILHSPGPDGDIDLPLPALRAAITATVDASKDRWDRHLNARQQGLIRRLVDPRLYDPTNGMISDGDLFFFHAIDNAGYDRALKRNVGNDYGWQHRADTPWKHASPPTMTDAETAALIESAQPTPQLNVWLEGVNSRTSDEDLLLVPACVLLPMYSLGVDRLDSAPIFDPTMEAIGNRLGREFPGFFAKPGPLSYDQVQRLDRWRTETPKWWFEVEGTTRAHYANTLITVRTLPPDKALTALRYFGKSQLLLAAQDAVQDRPREARRRIEQVRWATESLIENIRRFDPEYESRFGAIYSDLPRLCDELEKALSTPAPPAP
jgi:hypothetical protein